MEDKLVNMSDGESDGICIFYVKNGEIYPVALTHDQLILLDIGVSVAFMEQPLTVLTGQCPVAKVEILKRG